MSVLDKELLLKRWATYPAASDLELSAGSALLDLNGAGVFPVQYEFICQHRGRPLVKFYERV
jgi:hypothetical protein